MKNIASINIAKFFSSNTKAFDTFIWLGKNYLQLAVSNKDHTKIEALESFKKENGNITRSEALTVFKSEAVAKAESVFIALESKKNTLVPIELFDAKHTQNYLSELFFIEQEETIAVQAIKPIDCKSIFTLKKGTENLLNSELPQSRTLHAPSALLIAYQQMIPPNKEYISFIRLNEDEILLSIFKNQKLILHQSYDIENLEDAYFYYFEALEQLNISRNKMTLMVFGMHTNIDLFKTTIAENIETVKYVNRLPTLQYNDDIFSHPAHHFFNLFALLLCE